MEMQTVVNIKFTPEELTRTLFFDDNGSAFYADNLKIGSVYGVTLSSPNGVERITRGLLVDVKEDQYKNVLVSIKIK